MKFKLLLPFLLLLTVNGFADDSEKWRRFESLILQVGYLNQQIIQIKNDATGLQAKVENNLAKINQLEARTAKTIHHVGETYRGGTVFYVDESGQHGLIASKMDCSEAGIAWRNGTAGNKVTNARGDGLGAGENNTRLIVAEQTIDNQKGQFAALIAANFKVQEDGLTPCKTPSTLDAVCYGGWYLPSAYELQLLHQKLQRTNKAFFVPDYYWSSTESSVANAYLINFATGEMQSSSKANTLGRVRAISRF